jgi:hypothetical protein
MTRQFRLIACRFACLLACTLLSACYYPYAPYPTTTPAAPANFDRAWNAALGAAADVGIQINSADQGSGRISGSKAGAQVVILLLRQPDGSLQVSCSAPTPVADSWSASYNRRMGR